MIRRLDVGRSFDASASQTRTRRIHQLMRAGSLRCYRSPRATPVRLNEAARRMAELTRDDADAFVFNHWHELLPLSAVDHYLLPSLDGRRDRQALVETLMDVIGQDLLRIDRDDAPILDEECIRDVLAQQVDALPQRLTEMKLMSGCDHASVADHRRRA